MCLATSIYILDTLVGFAYTLYFVHFWFSREDNNPVGNALSGSTSREMGSYSATYAAGLTKRLVDTSQSASPARELFFTVSGTCITTAIRVYFCFVIVSFTKQLLLGSARNQRFRGHDSMSADALPNSVVGKVKKFVYELEIRAKNYLAGIFLNDSN
ncbi:hypothetical protein JCM33374_g1556 [Metschnikowia sp. JCM 33374]|nr:hypothetical protein JCM33374_g1556 [Metschnikowia sp. JCM 33374]